MKSVMFIGRFSPLHLGHKALIDQALKEGESVVVALRDTSISEKDPYSIGARIEMFKRVYGKKIKIIAIPDIKEIRIGREVGYKVVQLPKEVEKISATEVREKGKYGNLPEEIREYVKKLDERRKK